MTTNTTRIGLTTVTDEYLALHPEVREWIIARDTPRFIKMLEEDPNAALDALIGGLI